MNITAWKHTLLDMVFPPYCAGCGVIGSVLCEPCRAALPTHDPACFLCSARNRTGAFCGTCRRRAPFLSRVLWAGSYETQTLRAAVMQFKYHNNRMLAEPLASYIVTSLKKQAQGNSFYLPPGAHILSVPLHARKRRERGFNQSELLAKIIARELELPFLPPAALVRTRYTAPQAQVRGREARAQNIGHAFAVPQNYAPLICNTAIILVDDIATTASTLNDAARALKEAGAARVWGIVAAKG